MVNFGAPDTVPERYRGRLLYQHNPQVTLMRTTPDENDAMGRWIGERLNLMEGPVRFLLPEGGVSALDAPGQPFHDPAADAALFARARGDRAADGDRASSSACRTTSTSRSSPPPWSQHFRALHGDGRARAAGGEVSRCRDSNDRRSWRSSAP